MYPESAPQLLWRNSGQPPAKWPLEPHEGHCATCATSITEGVDSAVMVTDTFAQHADFLRFGSHVCVACGWLYGDPKRTHQNIVAAGTHVWKPMISADSATPERPSWQSLLPFIADMPPETPLAGVLTTDPKPRKWPLMQLTTVGAPGLVVHAPDYDVSGFVTFDLPKLILLVNTIKVALTLGYTKVSVLHGLGRDYKRFVKSFSESRALEEALSPVRNTAEFVPALVIAQKGAALDPAREPAGKPEPRTATRGSADQDQSGLFQ